MEKVLLTLLLIPISAMLAASCPEVDLKQNYPNPFNSFTTIEFTISSSEFVDLAVYDTKGHRLTTLLYGYLEPGEYDVSWDRSTECGNHAEAGMYFSVLTTSSDRKIRKMMLK